MSVETMLLEKSSMYKKSIKPGYSSLFAVVAILAVAVILTGCKDTTSKPEPNEGGDTKEVQPKPPTPPDSAPKVQNPTPENTVKPPPVAPVETRKSLIDVLRTARYWGPAREFAPLIGQDAPDFTLTDVNGKEHKLSDYRGKNVILQFWATWCPPCKMTVPHLMELRRTVSEDKLAIMALSYISPRNPEEKIKNFAATEKVNYPIFAVETKALGRPYNAISGLPTIFFIDTKGKIKLATTGLLQLADFKAILEAEWPKEPI